MSLDLSKDYLVIDDTQDVTYQVKIGEGKYAAPATVQYALWLKLAQTDFARNPALLQKQARVVHLWTIPLGSIVPKMGDLITDVNSVNWIVREVEYCDLDAAGVQRYRCTCTQQVT